MEGLNPCAERDLVVAVERIVAVGLLTQSHLDLLGSALKKAYPVQETPCFTELISAIDEADREYWREQDRRSS